MVCKLGVAHLPVPPPPLCRLCAHRHAPIPSQVREAQLAQYNFILVVGNDEAANGTVNVRTRDNVQRGVKSVDEIIDDFAKMMADHTLDVDMSVGEKKEGK